MAKLYTPPFFPNFWTLLLLLLALLIFLYLAGFAALYFYQERLLFFPKKELWRTPAALELPHEDVSLTTSDGGEIHGWFLPTPDARGTILYFHGNAGNLSDILETLQEYHSWGYHVLAIDYRGYGKSSGSPSEKAMYLDAETAWEFLVQEKQIHPEEIVLVGYSLGSGVATHLATVRQPAGLILEAAFLSIPDMASVQYPWFPIRWAVRHVYPNLENIQKITAPILIAHSPEDELVPFSQGKKLFGAASEPKTFFTMSGSHNDCIPASGIQYQEVRQKFLEDAISRRVP